MICMYLNLTKNIKLLLTMLWSFGTLIFVLALVWPISYGFFHDREETTQFSYENGTLVFDHSLNEFSPLLTPDIDATGQLIIKNIGSLPFKYSINFLNATSTGQLCAALNVALFQDNQMIYAGQIADLSITPLTLDATANKVFDWQVQLSDTDPILQNQTCEFSLIVKAWQETQASYGANMFSDEKILMSQVISGSWQPNIVLNEVLPNPEGDDNQDGLLGEWVELYNNDDSDYDLTDWYVLDSAGNKKIISDTTTLNNQTVIGAKGGGNEWLVLFMNAAILNNSGDLVYLFDNHNNLIDSLFFGNSSTDSDDISDNTPGITNGDGPEEPGNEGKSFARIPDGVGPWIDPVPTPGGPNLMALENNDQTETALSEIPNEALPLLSTTAIEQDFCPATEVGEILP